MGLQCTCSGVPCFYFSSFQKSGAAIVSDPERDKSMVQELLELKNKVDVIISEAFRSNERFQAVVRESFENVINRRQNKPAELIGRYSWLREMSAV